MDFFHFLTQVYTYKQNTLTRQKVQPMHRSSIRGVEDMASLEDLHEGAIMHNLYLRYKQKYIYVSFLQAILDENNTVIDFFFSPWWKSYILIWRLTMNWSSADLHNSWRFH